jgi:hypothetical protein
MEDSRRAERPGWRWQERCSVWCWWEDRKKPGTTIHANARLDRAHRPGGWIDPLRLCGNSVAHADCSAENVHKQVDQDLHAAEEEEAYALSQTPARKRNPSLSTSAWMAISGHAAASPRARQVGGTRAPASDAVCGTNRSHTSEKPGESAASSAWLATLLRHQALTQPLRSHTYP